jgi:hypothetical protein
VKGLSELCEEFVEHVQDHRLYAKRHPRRVAFNRAQGEQSGPQLKLLAALLSTRRSGRYRRGDSVCVAVLTAHGEDHQRQQNRR